MKEVLVTIPSDQKVLMDKIIEKFSIPTLMLVYGDLTRYEMKVNDYQINLLLEELKSLNIGSAYGEIVVKPISLLITSDKGKSTIPTTHGVNREEILANLSGVTSLTGEFVMMCFLAAILAAFGLLSNNVLVIIASMIVAPLLGPIALTSLALLSTETSAFFKKGLFIETVGLTATIVTGGFTGVLFRLMDPELDVSAVEAGEFLYPEIMSRTILQVPDITLALLGGLAAGIIIARGLDVSIVGVAIAASLCPPAAVAGILLAEMQFFLAFQAISLLLLNVLAINLSCSLVFWAFDVRSQGLSRRQSDKVKRMNLIWIMIVTALTLLLIVLILYK